MDHKLIMENWRRFVDESEDMDPELVEEGLKELAASLVIGNGDTSYTLPTTRADASDKVLTSDASGGVTWETPSGGGGGGVGGRILG